LHKQYAPKGLVIVSLTNEPKETVEPFAKQMAMTYPVGGGSTSGTLTDRLKGSGMRWDQDNAESLMARSGLYRSHLWQTYWNAQRAA